MFSCEQKPYVLEDHRERRTYSDKIALRSSIWVAASSVGGETRLSSRRSDRLAHLTCAICRTSVLTAGDRTPAADQKIVSPAICALYERYVDIRSLEMTADR